ncbi:MAG TPA: hypothetical protein DCL61_08505 [Cyanobacteria bacterium UBA12227]|nr:hypothetical protein [Cyanobacteria bacterium UBA12227]HAX86692.1 hypothetical protein [Cyanobacteria bacterium UBA11370]HBY81733.1 hypothetical protein [Cyanobacteria bacterium UBA11148]
MSNSPLTPDPIRDYLIAIGKHPLLTFEQEQFHGLRVGQWVKLEAAKKQL